MEEKQKLRYNYGISEEDYYRSMADTLITKKLMTSKVFSQEVIGQTNSDKIHRDVEKSINKILSVYLDQWYRDNPLKQFQEMKIDNVVL